MILLASQIGNETTITVGLVSAGIGTAICCTWWLASQLHKIDSRLETLERGHYTKGDAETAALRLAIDNPSIRVRDPRNPGKGFLGESDKAK